MIDGIRTGKILGIEFHRSLLNFHLIFSIERGGATTSPSSSMGSLGPPSPRQMKSSVGRDSSSGSGGLSSSYVPMAPFNSNSKISVCQRKIEKSWAFNRNRCFFISQRHRKNHQDEIYQFHQRHQKTQAHRIHLAQKMPMNIYF